MLIFCDFIQVDVFTTNHHLNKMSKSHGWHTDNVSAEISFIYCTYTCNEESKLKQTNIPKTVTVCGANF